VNAASLIRITRRLPDTWLRAAMSSPARRVIVGTIFRRMPELLSPAGRKARAVVRFDVTVGRAVDTWYLELDVGGCTVSRACVRRPRSTVVLSAYDLVRLAAGADPVLLFREGRLRLSGDTYFGASIGTLFDLPR
jgi:predicted lipid carrier protein YhbT